MTIPGSSGAAPRLLIDWDASGTFDADEDTMPDVVRPIIASRGRSGRGLAYDPTVAGKLTTRIRDLPKYRLSSSLRAMVEVGAAQLDVALEVGGVIQWYGQLARVRPRLSTREDPVIEIEALGVLSRLRRTPIVGYTSTADATIGARAQSLVPADIVTLSVDADLLTPAYSLGDWYPVRAEDVLEALRQLEEAAVGGLLELRNGELRFASVTARQIAPTLLADIGLGRLSAVTVSDELVSLANTIDVPIMQFSVGGQQTVYSRNFQLQIPYSGEVSFKIEGPGDGVAEWGRISVVPSTVTGTYTDKDYRAATIRLTGPATTVVSSLTVRGQPIDIDEAFELPVEFTGSVRTYGRVPYRAPAPVYDNYIDAQTYADRRLTLTSNPRTSPTVSVVPTALELRDLDLGVLFNASAGKQFSLSVFVERLVWTVESGRVRVSITGSPGNAYTSTFVLDNVLRGVLGTYKLA